MGEVLAVTLIGVAVLGGLAGWIFAGLEILEDLITHYRKWRGRVK